MCLRDSFLSKSNLGLDLSLNNIVCPNQISSTGSNLLLHVALPFPRPEVVCQVPSPFAANY